MGPFINNYYKWVILLMYMGLIFLLGYTTKNVVILILKNQNCFTYELIIVKYGINYTKKRLFVILELLCTFI